MCARPRRHFTNQYVRDENKKTADRKKIESKIVSHFYKVSLNVESGIRSSLAKVTLTPIFMSIDRVNMQTHTLTHKSSKKVEKIDDFRGEGGELLIK